jgi:hypothetical protein
MTTIPQGLSEKETLHYHTLIDLVRLNPGRKQPRIAVITDLAKDYDDLVAMIVLKELHRLGVVKLVGFIANLMPAEKRAQFGRGALDSLGLDYIPIAQGTSGFPKEAAKKHDELPYEFQCDFMATDDRVSKEGDGEQLLKRLCESARDSGDLLTLVLISSLEDIYTFSTKYPVLLKEAVSNIVLQGGYRMTAEGKLEPDESANNNRYDMEAAKSFHTFMQENHIPSTVYTKVAAFAVPLKSDLFAYMAETKHTIGVHLKYAQVEQDRLFYSKSCEKDPEKRFAPFMDQVWFLKNKTAWFDEPPPKEVQEEEEEGEDCPKIPGKDMDITPWLTKVVVYDALAALGASGADALEALGVLSHSAIEEQSIHRIVGVAGNPNDPGVNSEQMASVLWALMMGSLLSCGPQGNNS